MKYRSADISIIIPAYNEQDVLPRLLFQLEAIRKECQIIFVDGGSSDATKQIIAHAGYPCFEGKGRGAQLNSGARRATGKILFFLHCDSVVPDNPLQQICEVMEAYDMGFFGIRFDSTDWVMGVCGRQSNRRAKYRQIPFGDQGIFLKKTLFESLGGFPELPLMEDYQFSLNARKAGIHMGQTQYPLTTSARKYGTGFFHQLGIMYKMHVLRWQYRHGAAPEQLAESYRRM